MPRNIMDDYIPVSERISAFYLKHPEGSLQSELIELSDSRVVIRAYAYRSPTDEKPGIGLASMNIPGSTSFTRGSEVENTETSAWGRAIAALGFEVKRGIATREDVESKQEEAPRPQAVKGETETLLGELGRSRTGTIAKTKSRGSDLEARETPEGTHVGFRFDTPKGPIEEVWATGEVAAFLFAASGMDLAKLDGEHAVVNGMLYKVTEANRKAKWRLKLSAIETMGAVYPPTVPTEFPGTVLLPEEAADLEALPWPEEKAPA